MNRLAIVAVVAFMTLAASAVQAQAPVGAPAPAQTVRAAGMPLPDGALPPGSLTVRLVQGAFTGDLGGVTVEVVLDGRDTRRAQTGTMGRAEFAHLPIGAQVRASAIVNGERLLSEPFSMPAESGVRVLLVTAAGATAADAGGAVAHLPPPTEGVQAPMPEAVPPPAGESRAGATAVRITVLSLTILAFGFAGARQWRRHRR